MLYLGFRQQQEATTKGGVEAGMSMREMESDLIRKTLVRTDGNRTRAARMLQIGVRTLQRKIKAYGMQ